MDLQLVDHRPTSPDGRWWTLPFDDAVEYEHPNWWNRQIGGDQWLLQVIEDGTEAARVEFDDPGGINPTYADVPELGPERLEIQFIEVATAARGRGVGTQVVRELMKRHPDRRLFAYSQDADGFWAQLGWEAYYDPSPGPPGRTLFIQPAR